MNKLSILIPVYNEHETIAEVLRRVWAVDVNMQKEIIILDSGSTDGTREYLQTLDRPHTRAILDEDLPGKGNAVRRGFQLATGDLVIIQDADLEVNPAEYPALLAPLLGGQADVVFGSRLLNPENSFPWHTILANRVVTGAINLLFRGHLTDALTCYKVFRRADLARWTFRCAGFDLDVELAVRALESGLRLVEVPITYAPRDRQDGKKIHWQDGFRLLWALLPLRFPRLLDRTRP